MNLALKQAQRNLGNTKKNPSVGCVIVKNDCIISAGCTGRNGRPHAEQNAITYSKNDIKNSDLYVTLEPCSHYGRTPPCFSLKQVIIPFPIGFLYLIDKSIIAFTAALEIKSK